MKWIDLPPVWLLLSAALVWVSRTLWTAGTPFTVLLGTALVWLGLLLMAAAALTLILARTTVIPHRDPAALVTRGAFRLSRNPIYLADTMILAGLCLRWQAPLGFILVPVFVWWITHHFIRAEEARLRAAFGPTFETYAARVRRWL